MHRIEVVDSHTAGEPTRVVISGGPDLGQGSLSERAARFRAEFDHYRSAIVNEPRGSDVLVGALLLPPVSPAAAAAVIFFNNVGLLGMCGHGMIGLIVTLAHLGRIGVGLHQIDTPVGTVSAHLLADGSVRITNVPSYRKAKQVAIDVPGIGSVRGDVAWGGNWFFLVDHEQHRLNLQLSELDALTDFSWRLRQAVNAQGFPEVDHIELFAPAQAGDAQARNFVLCPGKAYDRSPCGTGTSAKLACLAAEGKLAADTPWVQESIIGSRFVAAYRALPADVAAPEGAILPSISGHAYVVSEATLLLSDHDPFQFGIRT